MAIRRRRAVIWAIGIIVAMAALAGLALQIAIWRNGPAVLDIVDRLTGGARDTQMLAKVPLSESEARKVLVFGPQQSNPAETKRPVLLFVHGGSWNKGNPDDYGFVARAFVPEGFVVVLAGYRLHPDAIYPAMMEDTAAAVAWTHQNIAKFGGDPDHIVLAGHSAGAYNVVMTALERRWLEAAGAGDARIAGVVGLAGPYDFYPFDSESTVASFGQADDPEATQPVNHVSADAPPKLLIHGEKDTLVRPRNSHELARRLLDVGAEVQTRFFPEMEHNDPLLALASPWRRDRTVVDTIAKFAREPHASVPVQDEIG
jgi:acetyl esterase/lipase